VTGLVIDAMLKIALVRQAGRALVQHAFTVDDDLGDARSVAARDGVVHLLHEGGLARIGNSNTFAGLWAPSTVAVRMPRRMSTFSSFEQLHDAESVYDEGNAMAAENPETLRSATPRGNACRARTNLQIHVGPDVIGRRIDAIDCAKEFLQHGLKGFVLKSHYRADGRSARRS